MAIKEKSLAPLVLIHDPRFQDHETPAGHPESPQRIFALGEALLSLESQGSHAPLKNLSLMPCELPTIQRIHSDMHIKRIAETKGKPLKPLDPDTFAGGKSYETALLAAGAAVKGVDAVFWGEARHAFVLVRPPGHHAESDRAMGFCLFNNIAVAAAHALSSYELKRVLILDWDVHHGNGTQEIFYSNANVCYLSVHQWPFYPGTGQVSEIGIEEGKGHTVNLPIPGGMGDVEYQEVFATLIAPVVRQYRPQLILVSAGFDAYLKDPLAGQNVTEAGFSKMTKMVMELAEECCEGKLVFVLEGGYHLEGLCACVKETIKTLRGVVDPCLERTTSLSSSSQEMIQTLKKNLEKTFDGLWRFD